MERYVITLYKEYKSYGNLFLSNDIEIDDAMIDGFYAEFCTSKSFRLHSKESEKFFDYLVNRLHLLGEFNMFDIMLPLTYKGYTCSYSYDFDNKMYKGNVTNEYDTYIESEKLEDFKDNFHNTIDYVVLMR